MYVARCVTAHNKLRYLHQNTPPLSWDESIAAKAQSYAEKLLAEHQGRTSTILMHEKPSELGENLYWKDNRKVGECSEASLSW